jgi:hypothetical protein
MRVISSVPDLKDPQNTNLATHPRDQQNSKLLTHPEALSALFLDLKAQLGAASWVDFHCTFKEKTGLSLSYTTLQSMAPRYRKANAPPVELCYMLGKSGLFKFPNGEPVTFASFYEVYFGDRHADGTYPG